MIRNRSIFAWTLAGLSAIGATAAPAQSDADREVVAKGRQQFEASCMHCHGANADGKGAVIDYLKIQPADLTKLVTRGPDALVTERVLKAVLGRHAIGQKEAQMPLLKDVLSPEQVYSLSEYIKTVQK